MKTSKEVEDYLEGNLAGFEHDDFSEELNKDKELASFVKLHEEINESITDIEVIEFRQKIKGLLSKKSEKKIKLFRFSSAIAAIFIIAFSIISITKQPDYNKAFASFYEPYETDLYVRSGELTETGINYAYLLYEQGEFQSSFEILESYNQSESNNVTARFYYGLCAIELGKYELAEENMLQVIQMNNLALQLHAKWYLGLLYIKTNRPEMAKQYLSSLSENENFYASRVDKLLKKYY